MARHEVADVVLKLARPLAFDRHSELSATGRFVIVDDFEIRGGGIVRDALPDGDEAARDRVRLRNMKWEHSRIAPDARAARAGQGWIAFFPYLKGAAVRGFHLSHLLIYCLIFESHCSQI